jgi:hypothetical protein
MVAIKEMIKHKVTAIEVFLHDVSSPERKIQFLPLSAGANTHLMFA